MQDKINARATDILASVGIEEYEIPWKEGARPGSFSSNQQSITDPSYNQEFLSPYEAKLKSGTIARRTRADTAQEVYDAYRQSIVDEVLPSDILAIAEIHFSGPTVEDVLCLRKLSF